jgi:hypothetical protein
VVSASAHFVHTLDERADRLRELGAEVVQGDLLDFPAVSAATVGVSAAYFNYPVAPGLVEATANFVQAASEGRRARGGQHVADLGAPGSQKATPPGRIGSPSGCWTAARLSRRICGPPSLRSF